MFYGGVNFVVVVDVGVIWFGDLDEYGVVVVQVVFVEQFIEGLQLLFDVFGVVELVDVEQYGVRLVEYFVQFFYVGVCFFEQCSVVEVCVIDVDWIGVCFDVMIVDEYGVVFEFDGFEVGNVWYEVVKVVCYDFGLEVDQVGVEQGVDEFCMLGQMQEDFVCWEGDVQKEVDVEIRVQFVQYVGYEL